jgi:ribosomal protein L34
LKYSLIVIKILTFPCVNLEVARNLRRLHSKELYDFYSLPNIIAMIKSRRMRWAWHVARMGEKRGAYVVLVRRPKGRDHL